MPLRNILLAALSTAWLALYGLPYSAVAVAADATSEASAAAGKPALASAAAMPTSAVTSGSAPGQQEERPYVIYGNARYGYVIAYPGDLLTAGKEADDGDGVTFKARLGPARVAVWGRYNATDDSPKELLAGEEEGTCSGVPASYEVSRADLVVFSCKTDENEIVYERMIIRDDTLAMVSFTYPATEQAKWAPVISKMGGSLRFQ